MFLRRSLASLARAYKLHVYVFLCRYIRGLAPPPPYQKADYATVASFRSPEEWPEMKMVDSVPPTRYTKSPPLIRGLAPPPPPHTKKLTTLLLPAFDHQKSGLK